MAISKPKKIVMRSQVRETYLNVNNISVTCAAASGNRLCMNQEKLNHMLLCYDQITIGHVQWNEDDVLCL